MIFWLVDHVLDWADARLCKWEAKLQAEHQAHLARSYPDEIVK